jgi:ABC-type transport system involved in multi-copper enzyme maturation permease subunit
MLEAAQLAATPPGVFYNDLLRVRQISNVLAIFFAANMLGKDYATGMLRTLISHGLRRSRYLMAKGVALFVSLVLAWSVCTMVVLAIGVSLTHLLEGGFQWQGRFWSDIVRMIAGNSLRQFVLACTVFLSVVLFRHTLIGALGGLLYLLLLEPTVPGLLLKLKLPRLVPYTSVHASKVLLDPDVALISLDFPRAGLVLSSWGISIMAIAMIVFRKKDIV